MARSELLKTFNCGIGMVAVVDPGRADALSDLLAGMGETVLRIGHVTAGQGVSYAGDWR